MWGKWALIFLTEYTGTTFLNAIFGNRSTLESLHKNSISKNICKKTLDHCTKLFTYRSSL